MIRNYKFRLYPNKQAAAFLEETLETHRRLYNKINYGANMEYELYGVRWNKNSWSKWLTRYRKNCPFLQKCNACSLRTTLDRYDEAMQSFFRDLKHKTKKAGLPKFKSQGQFNSFKYTMKHKNRSHQGCAIRGQYIQFTKRKTVYASVKVNYHREIPSEAEISHATFIKENGKWFVVLCVHTKDKEPLNNEKMVGIDLGLNNCVTTSDGENMGSTKFLEDNLKKLRVLQRKLSRQKKGSNRCNKTKHQIAKLHVKIKNTRADMQHNVSRELANKYGTVVAEDLKITNMVKNKHLSRRILDAGWGGLLNKIDYKIKENGGLLVKVDPKNTSQECSNCGEIVKKSLSVRVHKCECGAVLDRDHNAALNIMMRGAQQLTGGDRPTNAKSSVGKICS